ncbi:MAG: ATP-binding cassette domain-containing protein [Thiobacillus sp.]|nr:ATP-binding cassette domain-containing protein [Thiobacillus sp.]
MKPDLQFLLGYAAPYRRTLLLGTLIMLAESAMALAVPWLGGRLAQGFLDQAATGTLLLALLALLGAQALLKLANNLILGRSAARILADLRIRVYDHIQALPIGFHHQRKQGETLALLTHDVDTLSGFISGTLLSIVPLLITVAGALVFMFNIDPWLSLIAALLIPLFYLLLKIIGRRLRPLASESQQAYARMVGMAEENIGMLPAIKTFTREPVESARFRNQIGEIVSLNDKQLRIYAALGPGIQFLAAAGIVLVLWLAGERINVGTLGAGQLVTFLLYTTLLTRPVSALSDVYGQTQSARGAVERLMQVLTEPPEPLFHPGRELHAVRGEIEFRGIRFAYPGRPAALDEINLHIRAGETVALTGHNGAGKSTLAHLLMRLYEPDAGSVLIDGIDIREVSLQSLRRHIGVVPQHVLLFNGTVRDNIAYGRDNPAQADIEAAAHAARAHEFILKLPQGYDTLIGDRGVRLSGGQQQRLALARALLKDPPILILDEATAMFDPEGEREFLQECADTLRHRTVLLITHRPASLALADRVIGVRDGRINEGEA